MCGRYVSTMPVDAIRAIFGTVNAPANLPPSWNVAPTDPAFVVRRHPETGERHLDVLRWGLVPSFHKGDLKQARRPINARAETVATAPMFRAALASRRCLVPADAFYEWLALPDGKQPFAIARADGAPLALAGLWEGWRAPDGAVLRTFVILTCAAGPDTRHLHERVPVIVGSEDWSLWLGDADSDRAGLLRAPDQGTLRSWPVGRSVNSVRNNAASLLEPLDRPGATASG